MNEQRILFNHIAENLVTNYEDIHFGKMMSSPALTVHQKVFAFYYKDSMVFKLGKEFDLKLNAITDYELLNPFKNKPPLAGWYVIDAQFADKWEELALIAYEKQKLTRS